MKKKKEKIQGRVIEVLPKGFFKVEIGEGEEILAHLAGKLRMYRIKIIPGDKVLIEISPYDKTRGRIIYRL